MSGGLAFFFAGQCPWAVSGKRGQNVRAAVAVGAVYTAFFARISVFLAAYLCFPSGGLMFSGARNNQGCELKFSE